MEKKQTALEWLEQEFIKLESTTGVFAVMYELIEEAKKMEKDQIIDAHYEGQCDNKEGYPIEISKQYYSEKYDSERKS
jgi:hypothetical protein